MNLWNGKWSSEDSLDYETEIAEPKVVDTKLNNTTSKRIDLRNRCNNGISVRVEKRNLTNGGLGRQGHDQRRIRWIFRKSCNFDQEERILITQKAIDEEADRLYGQLVDECSVFIFRLEDDKDNQEYQWYGYFELCNKKSWKWIQDNITKMEYLVPSKGTPTQAWHHVARTERKVKGPWYCGHPTNKEGETKKIEDFVRDISSGMSEKDVIKKYPSQWLRYPNAMQRAKKVVEPPKAFSWKEKMLKEKESSEDIEDWIPLQDAQQAQEMLPTQEANSVALDMEASTPKVVETEQPKLPEGLKVPLNPMTFREQADFDEAQNTKSKHWKFSCLVKASDVTAAGTQMRDVLDKIAESYAFGRKEREVEGCKLTFIMGYVTTPTELEHKKVRCSGMLQVLASCSPGEEEEARKVDSNTWKFVKWTLTKEQKLLQEQQKKEDEGILNFLKLIRENKAEEFKQRYPKQIIDEFEKVCTTLKRVRDTIDVDGGELITDEEPQPVKKPKLAVLPPVQITPYPVRGNGRVMSEALQKAQGLKK